MKVQPLRTEQDHKAAVAEIHRLGNAEIKGELSDEDSARLDALAALVDDYERKRCPIEPTEPIDVIEFWLDQNNKTIADIAPLFGGLARAEAIMRREKALTLPIIWRLSEAMHLPAELLVRKYPLQKARPKPSEKSVTAAAG